MKKNKMLNMNQVFDLPRFLLLTAKHWTENRNKYLLSLLAIAALLFFWFIFLYLTTQQRPPEPHLQIITYYFGLFLVGCLYASVLFADLATPQKGINYLSLPASHFEKLLCGLLYGIVVFFICYTAVFYLVDSIAVHFTNSLSRSAWEESRHLPNRQPFIPEPIANVFREPNIGERGLNHFYYLLAGYLAVQSAFIAGSVYFARFSFVKTVIVLLVFGLLLSLYIVKFLHAVMPEGGFTQQFNIYFLQGGEHSAGFIKLPNWIHRSVSFLLTYAFAPLFWIVSYFRLKEKEL